MAIRIGLSLGLLYCIYLVGTRAIAYWYFCYGEDRGGIRIPGTVWIDRLSLNAVE